MVMPKSNFMDALHSERSAKSEAVMKDTWGFCFWE